MSKNYPYTKTIRQITTHITLRNAITCKILISLLRYDYSTRKSPKRNYDENIANQASVKSRTNSLSKSMLTAWDEIPDTP